MPYIDIEGEIPLHLPAYTTYQVYNVLDSAVTAQLWEAMPPLLNANHLAVYEREMRLQSLCLEMSTKGFPVDQVALANLLYHLEREQTRATELLHKFCAAVDFPPLNPKSPKQLADFFYGHLNLPIIYEFDRKQNRRKVSTDIKALEKLAATYPIAAPFVNAINAAKSASKMASVFKRGLEPVTKNLRCNFSPAGTETGRLSSQQNPYGRGTNAQNIPDLARQVICAPKDYLIANFDLKTAESIAVGYISGDEAYIKACLTGDLPTTVATMNWTDLPWTGNLREDKAIAERPYYRHFSYRDMAKRGGHLTNYYGQPRTMAMHLKLTTSITQAFQDSYFAAFPNIPLWHLDTIARIQTDGVIITPMGRERRFWGRSGDPDTHREAIAYAPQSLVADVWNEGLMQVQRWVIASCRDVVDLRAQVHDSGVFLIPKDGLHDIVAEIQQRLEVPVDFGPLGTMTIPTDITIGRRWNKVPKSGGDRFTIEGQRDYKPGMSLEF